MIIAVDFDGTIVEHAYPKIGRPIPFALETLKQMQKDGHILLMWTVRDGKLLQEAIEYVESNDLKFYAYNKNYPEEDVALAPRKLNADIFIDDRSVGGLPDWGMIYRAVKIADETGVMSFNSTLSMRYDDNHRGSEYKKKNFFIRLGEMFENNK